jgi:hypothetical protein
MPYAAHIENEVFTLSDDGTAQRGKGWTGSVALRSYETTGAAVAERARDQLLGDAAAARVVVQQLVAEHPPLGSMPSQLFLSGANRVLGGLEQ